MPTTYHKKYKQNFQEEIYERYQNLSEEKIGINMYVEKNKMRKYCRESYKNLFEDEKQKLVEYRKNIYIRLKKQCFSF